MENLCYVHPSRVTFGDTDCSGWIHFPKVFRHVEEAEHAYLRRQGLVVISRQEGGWPRAHVECDYRKPLHFDDEIEVRLGIERIGGASVSWLFEIIRAGEVVVYGKMVTVRVDPQGSPMRLTDEMRAALLPSA